MFRRARRLGRLVAAMAGIGVAILFLGLIPAGGFAQSSGDLVWILLVPLGAVLFLGVDAAAPAFGSVVVMVLAAVALDPYMRGAPQPSEEVKLVLSRSTSSSQPRSRWGSCSSSTASECAPRPSPTPFFSMFCRARSPSASSRDSASSLTTTMK